MKNQIKKMLPFIEMFTFDLRKEKCFFIVFSIEKYVIKEKCSANIFLNGINAVVNCKV